MILKPEVALHRQLGVWKRELAHRLGEFAEIRFQDFLAVPHEGDELALAGDLDVVPYSRGLGHVLGRGNHVVNGAGRVLRRFPVDIVVQ